MNLNKEQQKALELCFDPIVSKLFITGEGGTGKSEIIKILTSKLNNYILLAPTQSAALNIGGQTIHSFFKVRPVINLDVEKEEDVLSFDMEDIEADSVDDKIVVIDEVSMLGNTMLKGILSRISPNKLILFGDPKQLKPIKDKAVDWSAFCDRTVLLTHNFRVQNELSRRIISNFRKHGVLIDETNLVSSLDELKYDEDTVYIAHTNYQLSKMQKHFLGYSHGDVGDIVLTFGGCDDSITREYKDKQVPFFTNNDLMIITSTPNKFDDGLWECNVVRMDGIPILVNRFNKTPKVIVGDYGRYKKILKARFSKAQQFQNELKKKYKTKETSIMKKKAKKEELNELRLLWIDYFNLKNAPYARHHQFRTTYKSQGKSFENVVIDWEDLPSKDHKEVALGRAMNNITVILDEL